MHTCFESYESVKILLYWPRTNVEHRKTVQAKNRQKPRNLVAGKPHMKTAKDHTTDLV